MEKETSIKQPKIRKKRTFSLIFATIFFVLATASYIFDMFILKDVVNISKGDSFGEGIAAVVMILLLVLVSIFTLAIIIIGIVADISLLHSNKKSYRIVSFIFLILNGCYLLTFAIILIINYIF